MEPITLQQILDAREQRALRQQAMLARTGVPLISFSLNIAGPVKDTPLIRRCFFAGCRTLEIELQNAGFPVAERIETLAATGCEALYAVPGDPLRLKELCVGIEDAEPIGRLFDLDVIDTAGAKLDRAAVNETERGCIVCGASGRGCASRRVHSVTELQAATQRILSEHFRKADPVRVSDLVTQALLDEVDTTPKPGLVDRANTGSHRDMTVQTFSRSAEALRPYWSRCMCIGMETAALPAPETFRRLRAAGLSAERDMLAATDGVNTHKGAVFLLGILCGAIGRLWSSQTPFAAPDALFLEAQRMTRQPLSDELNELKAHPERAATFGQKIFLKTGLLGARGEAMNGFPALKETALPVFETALRTGFSQNDAGVYALLHLIARGTDTNPIARGGMQTARRAVQQTADLLQRTPYPPLADVEALDRTWIEQNLSPGGSADLLAATLFLHALQAER